MYRINVRAAPRRWFRILLLPVAAVLLAPPCWGADAQQPSLDGAWAVGSERACTANSYQLQTTASVWSFTDQKGGTNIEKVIQSGSGLYVTETVSSPSVRVGTRWEYRFQGPSRAEVRNTSTQKGFTIVRCATPSKAPVPTDSATVDSTPATPCDIAAAFPYDSQRKAAGVAYGALNASIAIAQCAEAVSRFPNSGRLYFQLGRALEKANRISDAIAAYRRAGENGHGGGFSNLGELYRDGKGVTRDLTEAERLFQRGAAIDYPEAQYNLANILLKKSHNNDDVEKARQLLMSALNAGYVDASKSLEALPALAPVVGERQASASADAGTTAHETSDNLFRSVMLGVWAKDCKSPASKDNFYSIRAIMLNEGPMMATYTSLDEPGQGFAAINGKLEGTNIYNFTLTFSPTRAIGHFSVSVSYSVVNNKSILIQSILDDGTVLVKDGIVQATAIRSPELERCSSTNLEDIESQGKYIYLKSANLAQSEHNALDNVGETTRQTQHGNAIHGIWSKNCNLPPSDSNPYLFHEVYPDGWIGYHYYESASKLFRSGYFTNMKEIAPQFYQYLDSGSRRIIENIIDNKSRLMEDYILNPGYFMVKDGKTRANGLFNYNEPPNGPLTSATFRCSGENLTDAESRKAFLAARTQIGATVPPAAIQSVLEDLRKRQAEHQARPDYATLKAPNGTVTKKMTDPQTGDRVFVIQRGGNEQPPCDTDSSGHLNVVMGVDQQKLIDEQKLHASDPVFFLKAAANHLAAGFQIAKSICPSVRSCVDSVALLNPLAQKVDAGRRECTVRPMTGADILAYNSDPDVTGMGQGRLLFTANYGATGAGDMNWSGLQQIQLEIAAQAEAERSRQAEIAAENARFARRSNFRSQFNVKDSTTSAALIANPFVFKDAVVTVHGMFVKMISESEALFGEADFGGISNAIVVSKVPPTQFRGGEQVILAVRVRGSRSLTNGNIANSTPDLEYVGSYTCRQNNCADF